MKVTRCLSMIVIVLAVATSVPVRASANDTTPPCCKKNLCIEGLQAQPCCQAPMQDANQDRIVSSQIPNPVVSYAPMNQTSLVILACGDHKGKAETDETAPEESALYLRNERFLI